MLMRHGAARRTGLGDVTGGGFAAWSQSVVALLQGLYGAAWTQHGAATVIPSNVPESMQPYVGQPAMRLDNATYVALGNAGRIDPSRPQVASQNGAWVYILGPDAAIADAPHTMTALERAENAIFSAGDNAADTLGLPSLDSIEQLLKGVGRDILVGVGVSLAIAYFLKRKR